ncbi:MAG TPA: LptA/OstA family protein [Thermodesulfovibrionales bacterium]|jgi:LPS-assembly protein|nr:LptA/OstA family protein [Thermodesulfovibrionales bacterium]
MRIPRQGVEGLGEKVVIFSSFLVALWSLLFFVATCLAEEATSIQSDSLEFEEKTSTYTIKGHAKIIKGLATLEAEEIRYNEKTGETTAEGNVVYGDQHVRIKAERAELNLESKTGTLYDAEIFSKKENSHVRGVEIEKTGDKEYRLKTASFTTCDAPIPAWCFKGRDVDLIVGDQIHAKDVVFTIKDQPAFYSPYFTAPVGNERKTGLLLPTFGVIKGKGFHYEQPLYLVLAENRDATFLLDTYSNRGVGEGVEYRFIETDNSKGNFWIYHIRDSKFADNFWDFRGVYENRDSGRDIGGFLNLNYMNSRNFYSDYNPYIVTKKGLVDTVTYFNQTTGRFLESTGEASLKLDNSRIYLTPQYLVDLKSGLDESTILQKLPEVGFFAEPRRIGPLVFSLNSSFSNFWRDQGTSGLRFDLFPRVSYSFGREITIMQTLGLRETAYSLSRNAGTDDTPHRENLDYTLTANARLIKQYPSFLHILEPSVGFAYISPAGSNLPVFDSTELYSKTATFALSLYNRFLDKNGEFLTVRAVQGLDFYKDDNRWIPLEVDAVLKRPMPIKSSVTYDVDKGRLVNAISDVGIKILDQISLSLGERYERTQDILFYTFGLSTALSKKITAEGSFWYDAKHGGLQDIVTKVKYREQCWSMTFVVTKRQSDYSFTVLFDLLGIGSLKL